MILSRASAYRLKKTAFKNVSFSNVSMRHLACIYQLLQHKLNMPFFIHMIQIQDFYYVMFLYDDQEVQNTSLQNVDFTFTLDCI